MKYLLATTCLALAMSGAHAKWGNSSGGKATAERASITESEEDRFKPCCKGKKWGKPQPKKKSEPEPEETRESDGPLKLLVR